MPAPYSARVAMALVAASLAVAPAGAQSRPPRLLVLNKIEASLLVIDPEGGAIEGRVPTGEGPHEVVVSGDGTLAFVANYGGSTPGSTISVIDVGAGREVRRVDLAPLLRPHGLAVAGGKVYFTAEVNKLVGRYDPADDRVDWLLGTGQNVTHMLLVDAAASTIFTANIGSDTVTLLERGRTPLDWRATVIPVGRGPEGLDRSPDGREVWAAHSRDGGVSIIDVAAKRVVETVDIGTKRSNRLKFTPDGRRVLISDLDAGELVVLDAAARRVVGRVALGRSPEGILVAPDGSRAFVAVTGDDQVAVIDLATLGVTARIPTGKGTGPDGMAWVEVP
jgi:YVTN family beta-propeller protein